MAERMGNHGLAGDYLTASLGAPPTRSERVAQTGQRAIEGLSATLAGSRLSPHAARLAVPLARA